MRDSLNDGLRLRLVVPSLLLLLNEEVFGLLLLIEHKEPSVLFDNTDSDTTRPPFQSQDHLQESTRILLE